MAPGVTARSADAGDSIDAMPATLLLLHSRDECRRKPMVRRQWRHVELLAQVGIELVVEERNGTAALYTRSSGQPKSASQWKQGQYERSDACPEHPEQRPGVSRGASHQGGDPDRGDKT